MSDNIHRDKLGFEIKIGDIVTYPKSNSLYIGKVVKLNPKMIRIERVPETKYKSSCLMYSMDVIILDPTDVLAHVLKGTK